jgi:hypothetical protein
VPASAEANFDNLPSRCPEARAARQTWRNDYGLVGDASLVSRNCRKESDEGGAMRGSG